MSPGNATYLVLLWDFASRLLDFTTLPGWGIVGTINLQGFAMADSLKPWWKVTS